jgi:acyl-coenzyme A synthetase/AMP-(fatty) acid ligase
MHVLTLQDIPYNLRLLIIPVECIIAIQEILETNQGGDFSKIPLFCSGSKGNPLMKGATDLDFELKSASTCTPPDLGRTVVSDGLCYIFTSGTTGMPKGAIIKQHR